MRGAPVGTGLFFNPDSNKVFASFLSLQGSRSSRDVIEAEGVLTFDRENQQYEISNKEN